MDIFVFRKKQLMAAACATAICCVLMVIFPTTALWSARKGISLWMTDVLPALLPFFICANFLQNIGVIRVFKSGIFPFIMSMLSGYPMGAKIVGDLKRRGEITTAEAKRLMSFCSTSGPAFMISAVGAGMLGSGKLGMIIACAHYAGTIMNKVLYGRVFEKNHTRNSTIDNTLHDIRPQSIQEALTDAMITSFRSLGIILAYIVMFMFASDLLHLSGILSAVESQEIRAVIKGILEMTVGCGAVAECNHASDSIKCVLCSFIISWGGLSVMGQTMSMLSGTGISMRYIFISKLTHGIFSAVAAFLITMFVL